MTKDRIGGNLSHICLNVVDLVNDDFRNFVAHFETNFSVLLNMITFLMSENKKIVLNVSPCL